MSFEPKLTPARKIESDLTLLARFEAVARAHPEREAVVFGEERLTYGDLDKASSDLAHWMMSQGVGPGDRVGVCLRPCPGIIVSLLAIQKLCGTYVPIDPDYPADRIRDIAEDAGLGLTLSQDDVIGRIGHALVNPQPYPVQRPLSGGSRPEGFPIPVDGQAVACVFYTSGTTGKPKGIALTYRNLAYYIDSAINQFHIGPGDTVLSIARYSFSISLFELMTSMVAGGTLVLLPRDVVMNYGELAKALSQATVAHIGPALMKGLARHIREHYPTFEVFSGLRHVSMGGDFVPPDLLEGLKDLFPEAELFVIYGCTEIACMGCYYPVSRDEPVLRSYLGRPFPGTECMLRAEDGGLANEGEVGEICFRGPGVMQGYLNHPEWTEAAFVEMAGARYYNTGDLGRIDATGNLEFLGRRDFQVKLRGQRIEVVEVESHLRRAPGVRDAVVSMAKADLEHSRLIAYLTLEDPDQFSLGAVREFLATKLPTYMQPSGWIVLDRMPLNVNLKISRKDLPLPTASNMVETEDYVEPRTDSERALAAIWQEVLGLERVGIHDHFFHAGGDSLMAINLCMLAAEQGFRISPSRLSQAPTIAQLLEGGLEWEDTTDDLAFDSAADGRLPSIPPVILRFLYERGATTPHHWNISRVLTAKRHLSPDMLEQAFRWLGARHDALRLRFDRVGGHWEARVLETADETISYSTFDLSDLPRDQQDASIARIAKDCHRRVNLTQGPLACMVLFELGKGRPQELFFVVHHFAMDVISWKIFWFDFDQVYRRLETGVAAPHPAQVLSFKGWAQRLPEYANSPSVVADVRAWIQQDWSQVSSLPKDLDNKPEWNTNDSAQDMCFVLSEEETRTLLYHFGGGAESVLLSALAVALSHWQKSESIHFDRLLHGRNAAPLGIDTSRTMGCMISYAPTLLKVDVRESPTSILESISAQMTAHGEAGVHVDLYRYLGADPVLTGKLKDLPRTEVLLNYRGQIDDVIERSHLFSGSYDLPGLDHDPTGLRLYPIAISADLVHRRLETRFVFSTNLHQRESVESLCAEFARFLHAVLQR